MLDFKQNKNIMGGNFKYKCLLPLAILAISVLLQGCKEDAFNPEKVKAAYQDRFPVKDIDPAMDWKMTRQVRINISVYEDAGVDYTIRIYDQNPLTGQSSAKLLAEGTANNTTAFTTVMDCPSTLTSVYVCRIDPHSRNVVKYVSIESGMVNTTFGVNPTTRAFTRAENSSITTYTPDRTESEIATLAAQAKELKNNPVLKEGDVYKISHGDTYRGKVYTDGISGKVATVIIEGTWQPGGNIAQIETGVDLIVTGTGKILLPESETRYNKALSLNGNSRLIVFQGGTIEGEDSGEGFIYLPKASDGRYNYNAGTIRVETIQMDGGGYLYNCGTLDIEDLDIMNPGGILINQGQATIEDVSVNSTIENGCYLHVTDNLLGNLIMGDNCATVANTYGASSGHSDKKIQVGSNSVLTIEEDAHFSYACTTTGPSNGYALIKIGNLKSLNGFKHNGGNIYYEVEKETIDSEWERNTFISYLLNTNGELSKWGESPIAIPAGDCTGKGNTPSDSGSETPTDPIPYTYVFEDNYPLVGDYDFNDVVLDVQTKHHLEKKTNHIKRIQLDVTLAAAGAAKALGVGLRIVGISKSDIKGITTGGADRRFQASFDDPYSLFRYNSGTHMEDGDPSVVIPIAGEVHNVFGKSPGTIINTGGTGITANIYTYEIIIELTDQTKTEPLFSKDNLDFFICYKYKGMQKRMEVHLYEFWGYGATAAGTVQQENLDLAGNNTWAICVPYGFHYPIEHVNISRTDEPTASAYPDFIYWARDRSSHQDWYTNPVGTNVHR